MVAARKTKRRVRASGSNKKSRDESKLTSGVLESVRELVDALENDLEHALRKAVEEVELPESMYENLQQAHQELQELNEALESERITGIARVLDQVREALQLSESWESEESVYDVLDDNCVQILTEHFEECRSQLREIMEQQLGDSLRRILSELSELRETNAELREQLEEYEDEEDDDEED